MTEIFILEANLRNNLGHFLNNTLGLKKAYEAAGFNVRVFTNQTCTQEVLERVDGKPLFRDQSLANMSPQAVYHAATELCEDFCRIGTIPDNSIVMIPTALQAHIFGLARFIKTENFPTSSKVILNFHWDNVSDNPEQAELYKVAFSRLKSVLPESQIFISAHTKGVAKALNSVSQGLPVHVMPMPQYYGEDRPKPLEKPVTKPVMTVLGRSIKRKGSGKVLDLVNKLHGIHPQLRFRIQSTSVSRREKWKAFFRPRISLILGGMPMDQYLANLRQSDIFLLPYLPEEYRDRTSGVFAECAAVGGIAVVPKDTWLARQIEQENAVGVIYDPNVPNSIENAVIQAAEQIQDLKPKAINAADYWWQNVSACAYVTALNKFDFLNGHQAVIQTTLTPKTTNSVFTSAKPQVARVGC